VGEKLIIFISLHQFLLDWMFLSIKINMCSICCFVSWCNCSWVIPMP